MDKEIGQFSNTQNIAGREPIILVTAKEKERGLKAQVRAQMMKEVARKWLEILLICAALLSPLLARASGLETRYVGLTIKLVGQSVVANFAKDWPKQTASIYTSSDFSLSDDLHQRTKDGRLSPADELQIEADLMIRQGMSYYLPISQAELRQAVNFTPSSGSDAPLTDDDLLSLVSVHIQLSLGVTALTANYLTDVLGIHPAARLKAAPAPSVGEPQSILAEVLQNDTGAQL